MNPIATALWITLIGMGLVFITILLLWGLMALLVRLTAEPGRAGEPAAPLAVGQTGSLVDNTTEPGGSKQQARKRQAVAAAVAVALAVQRSGSSAHQPEASEALSPWQAAHRAEWLAQRANPPGKKVVR